MRRTHEAHVIPVTGNVTCSDAGDAWLLVFSSLISTVACVMALLAGMGELALLGGLGGAVLEEGEKLTDDALALARGLATDGGGDARLEVVLKEQRVHAANGALDRLKLLDDVHAVGVFVNHLDNAPQVAINTFQTVKDLAASLLGWHIGVSR